NTESERQLGQSEMTCPDGHVEPWTSATVGYPDWPPKRVGALGGLRANHLLGLRVTEGSVTLTQHLEMKHSRGEPFVAERVTERGTLLVKLTTMTTHEQPESQETYWFDEARDFMPVKFESERWVQ